MKSDVAVGVQDAGVGQVLANQALHAFPSPSLSAPLAAPAQRGEPQFADLIHELAQPIAVARHRVVVQPTPHN